MNDVTVVTSVTYPSSESLALVADVQYHEPYLSAALNRKFRGIVDPGFYAGFLPGEPAEFGKNRTLRFSGHP